MLNHKKKKKKLKTRREAFVCIGCFYFTKYIKLHADPQMYKALWLDKELNSLELLTPFVYFRHTQEAAKFIWCCALCSVASVTIEELFVCLPLCLWLQMNFIEATSSKCVFQAPASNECIQCIGACSLYYVSWPFCWQHFVASAFEFHVRSSSLYRGHKQ